MHEIIENPFILDKSEYKRDLNLLKHYVENQALYLNLMTGKPLQECADYVKASLRKGGRFEFKDPLCQIAERGENGDRKLVQTTLLGYITDTIKERDLVAPTFTTYLNPKKKESLLVSFIDGNVARRSQAKHKQFEYKMAGNKALEAYYKNEQNNRKIANNSISGAHLSASQPLFNKTGHSTLTSNCRATSGFGNANNEKLLSGNRHYWDSEIVIANIVSIVGHSDYDLIERAMRQFDLVYPTVEQTLECIRYSTDLYWADSRRWATITRLVSNLTDIQRAAFVYTGDLYQLARLNDSVIREMIGAMAQHPDTPHADAETIIKSADTETLETAIQVCEVEMRGFKLGDVKGTDRYGMVASACLGIQKTVRHFSLLIRAFLTTDNVPASLAAFPESIRRSALTSDTDSTIFTVQDWVQWYHGRMTVDPETNAVAAVMVYFSSMTIIHVLAKMSAHFGIEEKRLHQVGMKNEYKFDVFVPTQVAKHYFAMKGCQEGNLFAEYEKEIKGVHLKSSNAPRAIMNRAEEMMLEIMNTVMAGKKIRITDYLKEVASIERQIHDSLARGDGRFFRKGSVKPLDSYKRGKPLEQTPYVQYMLWEEVFAKDYGSVPPPPYVTVRIATSLDSANKTKEWLDGLENQEFAARMRAWMQKYNKKYLGSVQLPEQLVSSKGIPKEVLDVAGIRKIILSATSVFYLIFESLGFFMLDKRISRLCMDMY